MKTTTIRRFWLALVLLTCGLSPTARGQDRIPIESLAPGKSLFSIGVFSDNGGGSPLMTETLKVFRNRIKPLCFIGLGDHFGPEHTLVSMEKSFADAYGSTDAFYDIFYPVIGDNEDRILPNGEGRPGGAFKFGWFERCKIAKLDGTILRDSIKKYESTHGDYYAVLEEKGLRIHLVALYYPDTMGGLSSESVTFAGSTCKMIKQKYPNEPLIVYAHNGAWWTMNRLPDTSPIFKADIMMGASTHKYIIYDVPGDALAFNTCILAGRGHVFEIRVFKECFVLLALQSGKCLMGPMEVHDWRKVWVKPFGKKPYPVVDWDEIGRIAPEIVPPATKGFNRERAFFNGFARSRYKEMPSIGELEKELNSMDPETRAVALMSLGYSKDADKALKLLKEYLPKQKDPGIQARVIKALVRTQPRVSVPLLNDLFDSGKESMLSRHDLPAIAKESILTSQDLLAIGKLEHCPDKVRFFTAMLRGNDYYFSLNVIVATKGFNRDEWKEMGPLLLEILERDNVSKYHWYEAAKALGYGGFKDRAVLKLNEHLKSSNNDLQNKAKYALERLRW